MEEKPNKKVTFVLGPEAEVGAFQRGRERWNCRQRDLWIQRSSSAELEAGELNPECVRGGYKDGEIG